MPDCKIGGDHHQQLFQIRPAPPPLSATRSDADSLALADQHDEAQIGMASQTVTAALHHVAPGDQEHVGG